MSYVFCGSLSSVSHGFNDLFLIESYLGSWLLECCGTLSPAFVVQMLLLQHWCCRGVTLLCTCPSSLECVRSAAGTWGELLSVPLCVPVIRSTSYFSGYEKHTFLAHFVKSKDKD